MSFEVGSIIEGKVTGITKFGAFVEIEPGVNGMVHISEIAATFVSEIRDFIKEGQNVKVKVLSIGDNGKVSLSIKKALPPQTNSGAPRSRRPAQPANLGQPKRPAEFDWNESKNEPTSFEDMMTRFKQNSNDKMSGMKQRPAETRRSGYSSRKNFNARPDDY